MASQYSSGLISLLVGPEKREFVVHKELLYANSSFFRDNIDAVPAGLSSAARPSKTSERQSLILWLADESSGMFELFILWLYHRHEFRDMVEEAVAVLACEWEENRYDDDDDDDDDDNDRHENKLCLYDPAVCFANASASSSGLLPVAQCCSELHWNLVNLHLFAALIDVPALQDVVMDCLQDLYLRLDWEASPSLIRVLYAECDPFSAFRLRKWAVALLAWTLSNRAPITGAAKDGPDACAGSDPHERWGDEDKYERSDEKQQFLGLLEENPQLLADYDAHMTKMAISKADVRIKNPQLRIPSNVLRREDRHFGFRQCAFHSHRRAVGQGHCPYSSSRSGSSRNRSNYYNNGLGRHRCRGAGFDLGKASGLLHHAGPCYDEDTLSSVSPSSSTSSVAWSPCSAATSEPRHVDLPAWSPLSLLSSSSSSMVPLGLDSTF